MAAPTTLPAINQGHNVKELRARAGEDLVALVQLYGKVRVTGQADNTVKAKARDLVRFVGFYEKLYGHTDPAEWYPSVSAEFLKTLQRDKRLADATVYRVWSTVRHFGRWAHENAYAFPNGCPVEGVKPPREPEPEWKGLERKDELRLVNAARTLALRPGRGSNQGARDLALIHCLMGTGLRVSELLALDVDQFSGRAFQRVPQKGGGRRNVNITKEARDSLEAWLEERGDEEGPLFTTRTGRRLGRQQAYDVIKRAEKQANAQLPEEERFTVTPHVLRHTLLRKLAEQKGLPYALKQSGHKSDRYIWRYVQPSEPALEAALEDLD